MNRRGFLKGLFAGIAGAVVGVKIEAVQAAEEERVGGYVTLSVDYSYGAGCIYPPSIVDKFRTYPECVGDIRIEYDEPVEEQPITISQWVREPDLSVEVPRHHSDFNIVWERGKYGCVSYWDGA